MLNRLFPTLMFTFISTSILADETSDHLLESWRLWATEYGITETAIAIGKDGEVLASDGINRESTRPYPVMSLSKALTAVCLTEVLKEKGLPLTSTLAELQTQFDKVNISMPSALSNATVGQLMTMTAGLEPDLTQGDFNRSYRYGDTRNIGISKQALQARGLEGDVGTFFYNNGSYALLGALLEALTETDNVDACAERLFPSGTGDSAKFDDDWIGLAAFGGWAVSAEDYLAFVMSAFDPEGDIAQNLLRLPNYRSPERGWYYGLGTYFRLRSPQNIFWHFGAVCGTRGPDQGSYFAYYDNGYAVSVNFNACSREPLGIALDAALWDAAH